MDGIEAALLRTDGIDKIQEIVHTAFQYPSEFKILLKVAEFAARKYEGNLAEARKYYPLAIKDYLKYELKIHEININTKIEDLAVYIYGNKTNESISFDKVVQHSTWLHGELVKKLMQESGHIADPIDVVGYHGQTLFHNPAKKITVQVGDGQALADQINITVVNDFRSQDVAMGGQGAPFAPLYHQALATRDNKLPVVVVNCGGIANVSLVRGKTDQDVIGFDTGPGNGLIDRYVCQRTQGKETFDLNGKYGQKGSVNEIILQ
ncbi:MAG: anhydro-N-acetylmuramic acid kinase, partial [Gammaproteobacteria bacterium]